MVKQVVLFHLGRCGSTLLAEMLARHSQITWHGEIFEPRLQEARKKFGWRFRLEGGDPVAFTREHLRQAKTEWAGVEVKPFHLAPYGISTAEFIQGMRETGVDRFVVLDRRNRLRKIVSSQIAQRTNIWHARHGTEVKKRRLTLKIDNLDVEFSPGPLLSHLKRYDVEFGEIRRRLAPDFLDLYYEQSIQNDPSKAYGEVLDFLGLAREPSIVHFSRTNPYPLSDILRNYDEVLAHLAGTDYEWMLRE